LKWNGNVPGKNAKMYKGMVQVPLQLSAGYRAINFASIKVTPFVAFQLQALFGYNPDFIPLPIQASCSDSNLNFK
jgi:hypothetical protein